MNRSSPVDPAGPSDRSADFEPLEISPETILAVRDLSTRFFTNEGRVNAVESLSFNIERGEVFGVVGESGSGKSVTGLSILDLVDSPGEITSGEIWLRDSRLAEKYRQRRPDAVRDDFVDLRRLPDTEWHFLRGRTFSMIFQDPMSSFSPTHTVGDQIAEAVEVERRSTVPDDSTWSTHNYGLGTMVLGALLPSKRFITDTSRKRAIELLNRVGIPDAKNRATDYPHQFSGGMLQRAMIAQALAGKPDLLIADEPTTALDVTIQAQILNLLESLKEDQDMGIIYITHDLGVIARIADRIGVMYAGEIAERGTPADIFEDHVHPYTEGLFGSSPDMAISDPSGHRLTPIEGTVPSLLDHELGDRCYFADRCPKAMEECLTKPPEFKLNPTHGIKCYLADRPYDADRALDSHRLTRDTQ